MKLRRLGAAAAVAVVAALFVPQALAAPGDINVVPQGLGSGTVTEIVTPLPSGAPFPGPISCTYTFPGPPGGTCMDNSPGNEQIELTATPAANNSFGGWQGTCPTAPTGPTGNVCTFTVPSPQPMQPYNLAPLFNPCCALNVTKAGAGTGTVTSSPAGINCGTACSANFTQGSTVTLTATPASGSTFGGWGGGCGGSGTNLVCIISMNVVQNVTATFNAAPNIPLTVTKSGNGQGSVSGTISGLVGQPINCGSACSASFVAGTVVVLTASPAPGSSFAGWSGGGCAGAGTCTVTVNTATQVNATFSLQGVQASLIAVRVVKNRFGQRIVRVTMAANERVRAFVQVRKDGGSIRSATVRFGPGSRNVGLLIRNRVSSGRAQVRVRFTDQAGATKTVGRGFRLPKAGL